MSDDNHRISKAPPPPTYHLSGTGGGPSKPRYQAKIAPDWSFWPPSRRVAPWQAVALSLNLDPDSLTHSPHGWMAGPGAPPFFLSESFPDAETETKFKKRSDLLASYRPSHEELLPLQDFATWAASVNLAPIPPELAVYAIQDTAQATEAPPVAETVQEGSAGTDRAALMARHKELTADGCKSVTATLASEFGISGRRVRTIKKEEQAKPRSGMGAMVQQLATSSVHKIGK